MQQKNKVAQLNAPKGNPTPLGHSERGISRSERHSGRVPCGSNCESSISVHFYQSFGELSRGRALIEMPRFCASFAGPPKRLYRGVIGPCSETEICPDFQLKRAQIPGIPAGAESGPRAAEAARKNVSRAALISTSAYDFFFPGN